MWSLSGEVEPSSGFHSLHPGRSRVVLTHGCERIRFGPGPGGLHRGAERRRAGRRLDGLLRDLLGTLVSTRRFRKPVCSTTINSSVPRRCWLITSERIAGRWRGLRLGMMWARRFADRARPRRSGEASMKARTASLRAGGRGRIDRATLGGSKRSFSASARESWVWLGLAGAVKGEILEWFVDPGATGKGPAWGRPPFAEVGGKQQAGHALQEPRPGPRLVRSRHAGARGPQGPHPPHGGAASAFYHGPGGTRGESRPPIARRSVADRSTARHDLQTISSLCRGRRYSCVMSANSRDFRAYVAEKTEGAASRAGALLRGHRTCRAGGTRSRSASRGRASNTQDALADRRRKGRPDRPADRGSISPGEGLPPPTRRSRSGRPSSPTVDLGVARPGRLRRLTRSPSGMSSRCRTASTPRSAMSVGTAGFTAAIVGPALDRPGLTRETGPCWSRGPAAASAGWRSRFLRRGHGFLGPLPEADEEARLTALGAVGGWGHREECTQEAHGPLESDGAGRER